MSYTQHCITTMAAPSWKCLPAVDGDPQHQGLNDSGFGSASETAGQEDRGLSFLLKQEDREIQGAYRQLFTKLDVALKEMKQYVSQINRCALAPVGGVGQGGVGVGVRFASLSNAGILGRISLCSGGRAVGYLLGDLAMPLVRGCDSRKCPQTLPDAPWVGGGKSPP